jgi:hypothetical protein
MVDNARISQLLDDRETIVRAVKEGARQAIRDHRAAGVPLVSWDDEKGVVLLDPETLEELPADEAAAWLEGRLP